MSGSLFRTGDVFSGCSAQSGDVQASVRIDARVTTVVRSQAASTIQVVLDKIDESTVTVTDWNGKPLAARPNNESVQAINFPLVGVGAYTVRILGRRTVSASGPNSRSVDERGTFRGSVR